MTSDPRAPATPKPSPDPGRRHLLYAGVAAAAAIGGGGLAIRQGAGGASASRRDPTDLLWSRSFETPSGEALSMAALRAKPLLLNFWATWCPPCVEELPLLDRFYREHVAKSWQVVGLAVDQPGAVRAFLARTPVSFPIGLAGLGGTELSKSLGNEHDGLPFTVVLNADGKVVQRRMGRLSASDLAAWTLS